MCKELFNKKGGYKMRKGLIVVLLLSAILVLVGLGFAQDPIPMVTPTLIDSAVYNGIYLGKQTQIFCEPTTGYLVSTWYRYYSTGPDPRRITAAYSMDDGQTWTIIEEINFGVGTEMNARYASVWGTSKTPIITYADRNPAEDNKDSRPVVAYDLYDWGGGIMENVYVDDIGTADTVLYGRYNSISTAPDNEDLWGVANYHNDTPGEAQYFYYSTDAGQTWSRPRVPFTAVEADSGNPNWVFDLSSTGMGVKMGNNNTVFAVCVSQWYNQDDLWRLTYSMSTDMGETWSPASIIPGAENLNFSNSDTYNNYTSPLLDGSGNWHIFAVGVDTTEDNGFPQPYRAYDFRFDGTTWTINKFVTPQLLDNGILAYGDYPGDVEDDNMNAAAVGPDGTLYYGYTDVVDTTGAMGDEDNFNYSMMIMVSEDNGTTWKGPVPVLENWTGWAPMGLAPYATDKIHIAYRRHFETTQADPFYYMGIPTADIKALAATTGIETIAENIPENFSLSQNYPNPFNPTTTIRFNLEKTVHVNLSVFNSLGQKVATIVDKVVEAGQKGISWNASSLPSGTYYYRLRAGDFEQTKEMLLIK
jgi:hypothetical protein